LDSFYRARGRDKELGSNYACQFGLGSGESEQTFGDGGKTPRKSEGFTSQRKGPEIHVEFKNGVK